ncbi:1-acyl-sn-glycerol-3-phosphate acyltransferase gamma [Hypomesus transpacificus]|uniref:1-acyl-sn-glycerol-3-phosphate acyltransferase gamma n=1 Tax=Hypomesus transpacificus TaxID=137520 RepID=UPI001F0863E3|nr:1-acyl-sn-glycerol-3-phosphate acyltransferase gamma [Hypomesus transpacificus]XP_046886557.1 1-acyl-sn-glycerol-3-phosphate acyltransferase gamma [Hypomesus transpacificus]
MALLDSVKRLFVFQLLLGLVFVVSGLIINFLQLLSCVLWPFNRALYRRLNCRLAYSLWSQLVNVLEWWSGTECTLFTDQATVDRFGKEHAIIILNHNYEIDFLCGWTMSERYGVLGSTKVLAKYELLKVPLIGWTWYFLEIVFCKRKWEDDRDTVLSGLASYKDYPEHIWLLLYCEGTRFTKKKHELSMQVADSKGLPHLKHHLLPRTKGFTTSMACLRGTVSAVYDVTLNFRGNERPTLLSVVRGDKYMADMNIRRYAVDEIPEGEKECADWLHNLYREKDSLQDYYIKEGCFPGPTITPRRRPWTLLNFLVWAGLLLWPLSSFAWGIIVSGNLVLSLAFLGGLFIASVAMQRLISVSEVKNTGSSYGNQASKKQD